VVRPSRHNLLPLTGLALVLGAAGGAPPALSQVVSPTQATLAAQAQLEANALTKVDALTNNISALVRSLVPATLDGSLSCPVFVAQSTLLTEDRCVWTGAAAQRIDQYKSDGATGSRIDDIIYNFGGQTALAPGWFVGGSVSVGSTWAREDDGGTGHGRIIGGSLALTYTDGAWLFAGAIAAGTLSSQDVNSTTLPGALESQTDTSLGYAGSRLRIAREFAFDTWYVRPRTDVDLIYAHTSGLQSVGQSGFAVSVQGITRFGVVASPMVEAGARIDLDATTILRPYLAIGMSVYPNHSAMVVTGFMRGDVPLGSVQQASKSPSLIGDADIGVQLYRVGGLEVRTQYDLRAANAYLSQGVSLRGAYHF